MIERHETWLRLYRNLDDTNDYSRAMSSTQLSYFKKSLFFFSITNVDVEPDIVHIWSEQQTPAENMKHACRFGMLSVKVARRLTFGIIFNYLAGSESEQKILEQV